jgi:protocatechuate 3,4-dioxygenase beta subunit
MKRLHQWVFVLVLALAGPARAAEGGVPAQVADTNLVIQLRAAEAAARAEAARLAAELRRAALAGPSVTMTGTVRDPSGKPVEGAEVTLYPGHYQGAPEPADATTDKNGRYEMLLQIDPRIFGGEMMPTNSLMARDLKRNLAAIQEFYGTPTNLDLDLQPGLRLSGFVTDAKGAPMDNIPVNLWFESGSQGRALRPQPEKTDATGLFSIPALPQGREYDFPFGITAAGYGWVYQRLEARDAHTNHYEFPTFVLKPADRKLTGQVLGEDGKPVEGAEVGFHGPGQPQAFLDGAPAARSAQETDARGRFILEGVCEGPVTVTVNYGNIQGTASAQGGDTNVVVKLAGKPGL